MQLSSGKHSKLKENSQKKGKAVESNKSISHARFIDQLCHMTTAQVFCQRIVDSRCTFHTTVNTEIQR